MASITLTPKRFLLSTCISFALLCPQSVLSTTNSTDNTGESAAKVSQDDRLPLADVQRFSTAISEIKSYYVKKVDDKKLFDDAIRGMLSGLDPHSAYLDEEDFRDLTESTKGEFGGLGIEVTLENGVIKVISPIDDTPAAIAGIKAGDYIVRINDKPMRDVSLKDAVNLMRGPKGSQIKLMVVRKNATKPLTFTLLRDVIRIKSVKSKMLPGGYAYFRVSHFQSPTVSDLKTQFAALQKQANNKINGFILDLRNNPGGLLDSAVDMSDLFISSDEKGPAKLIVFTKGRIPGSNFTAKAHDGDILKGAPMVVLINGGSASGSEIVAGALKDNHRALIVGTKSFGKGSVQTVLPLDQKSGIKLTTALYYTPSGRSIQAEGIVPDVVVEEMKFAKDAAAQQNDDLNYSEADLQDHLANGNSNPPDNATPQPKPAAATPSAPITIPTPTNPTEADKDLLHTDFQLYQAYNLLKSLRFNGNQLH